MGLSMGFINFRNRAKQSVIERNEEAQHPSCLQLEGSENDWPLSASILVKKKKQGRPPKDNTKSHGDDNFALTISGSPFLNVFAI